MGWANVFEVKTLQGFFLQMIEITFPGTCVEHTTLGVLCPLNILNALALVERAAD